MLEQVKPDVTVHFNLKFPEYYDQVDTSHCSVAEQPVAAICCFMLIVPRCCVYMYSNNCHEKYTYTVVTFLLARFNTLHCATMLLQIHRTHALLMLLGSKHYLIQKMSSTVVSSLMTATPVIADQAVLDSYTFLKPEHVFTMQPGETEMDVMQRVSLLHLTTSARYNCSAYCCSCVYVAA